ncbi:MAG: hypothetical protein R3B40_13305 [Polyangiales bacterium]|nr:hypothetical protein [Sandaracinaceae bacterium]
MWQGTRAKDWLLLGVCLMATVGSVAGRAYRSEDDGLLAVGAFFGACTVVAIKILVDRRRAHQTRLRAPGASAMPGQVPIVPNRRRVVGVALGIAALGAFMAVTGASVGRAFVIMSVLLATLGLALLVASALGRGAPTLTFTPLGLRVENRVLTFLVPWDEVYIRLYVLREQDFIALTLKRPEETARNADVRRGDAARERAKLDLRFRRTRKWAGDDFHIAPAAYDVDMETMLRALQRYATDPAARAELAHRVS